MGARLQGRRGDASAPPRESSASAPATPQPRQSTAPPATDVQEQAARASSGWLRYAPITAVAIVVAIVAYWLDASRENAGHVGSVDEIARVVAEEVDRRLRGDADTEDPARRTMNIAAYEAYLRGNDPAMNRSPAAAAQSLEHFQNAVALDPSYAAAWVGVAKLSMRVAFDDSDNADELYEQAAEAANNAVALDPSNAEAYAVTGLLHMRNFDLIAAEASLKTALSLDPARGQVREWLVTLHLWMGKLEQALAEATRATQLNPLSPSATAELARALAANGRCDDALHRLESISHIDPPLLRVPFIVAHCHEQDGRWQSAVDSIVESNTHSGPLGQAMWGYVLARSGQHEEARRVLDDLHASWQAGEGDAFPVAMLYAGLGDSDQLFAWLERSIQDRSFIASPDQFTMLQPVLDALRGDPRFANLPMLAAWRDAM